MDSDSPLSVSSNVIGILTFLVAVSAAAYARVRYLRNAHTEYLRVKKSLMWFKTESEWLGRLLQPMSQGRDSTSRAGPRSGMDLGLGKDHRGDHAAAGNPHGVEAHMFGFVMEDLGVLEQRLLDLVGRIDSSSGSLAATVSEEDGGATASWFALARSLVRGPSVTMAWLSSRTEMLELVR
jgi:hypothetical protein